MLHAGTALSRCGLPGSGSVCYDWHMASAQAHGASQSESLPAQPQVRAYQISVNVDLVLLNATVRDQKGRFASDLREQDFEVYEDGVRQSIRLFRHEDIPGHRGTGGRPQRKHAAEACGCDRRCPDVRPVQQPGGRDVRRQLQREGDPGPARTTSRSPIAPEDLASAIANAPATGMTALYDAIVEARKRLQTGSRDKKVLIVISDGGDNASSHTLAEVLKMAGQSSALVYTIGIFDDEDPDRNPAVLRRLAAATGGEAFFPGRTSEVVAICERIARDIRNQYTLGYVSTSAAQPGAYRTHSSGRRGGGKRQALRARPRRLHRRWGDRQSETCQMRSRVTKAAAADSAVDSARALCRWRPAARLLRVRSGGRLDFPAMRAPPTRAAADWPANARRPAVSDSACRRPRPAA